MTVQQVGASRRELLKAAGVSGLAFSFFVAPKAEAQGMGGKPLNVFVRVAPDNVVTIASKNPRSARASRPCCPC
jgi:isoquinoline 1-oxidoreductase beta subunit